ncbi:hypothetical protein MKX03_019973, partial [Papaver bracteatum]
EEEDNSNKGFEEEEEDREDDEDLFEIDLDAVNKISPTTYWEGCLSLSKSENTVLLGNCLLPISEISKAVPMLSSKGPCGDIESSVKNASRIVMMIEFVPEKFWGSPFALGLYDTYRKSLLGSV